MDFVPTDDTIQLSDSVFKKFTEGPLLTSVFNDGGKQDKDDRLLYRDGKLSYDADAKGGDKPVVFAKVVGAPALTDADFVVVT